MRVVATMLLGLHLLSQGTALAGEPESPAGTPVVVTTAGKAVLKICRDWLVGQSCREYARIEVPPRIGVGDSFEITFGSNPKTIRFRVKSLTVHDGDCLLIPEHEDMPADPTPDEPGDMLIVKGCRVEGAVRLPAS